MKTETIKSGDSIPEVILKALNKEKLTLEDNDAIAVASKAVAQAEGRLVALNAVTPSEKAKDLARQYLLQPEFAELVLHEAEEIYGGVEKTVLALKDGVLAPNAGIDNKNAPVGSVMLWPSDPKASARKIREQIRHCTGRNVAVLIVDSGLVPLRIGTVGLALAVAGFKPIRDTRGDKDIYGKPLVITRHAVADDLACAAHLLMGEAAEQTPIVLIRGAPVDFDDCVYGPEAMMMPLKECLFMGAFLAQRSSQKGCEMGMSQNKE
jgi:coenzyme F420-0:L-glutamate ligase